MTALQDAQVAIVGGGPAGAALAWRLASAGIDTAVFERLPRARWRASGVYSSPLSRALLADVGLHQGELARLIRPISAMVVQSADGEASCRLDYPAPDHACGVDRVALDERLLEGARAAGARVHEAAVVQQLEIGPRSSRLLVSHGGASRWWTARLVVGADGPSSTVARAARVAVAHRAQRRAALTGHRADAAALEDGQPMEARMIVGAGWYLGVAPVPNARVNLGLVLGEAELRRALAGGATVDQLMASTLIGITERSVVELASARPTDRLQARVPLAHRVTRAAGPGFALVGDACGFIDPLSGEGLHRALVSAEMAADAIAEWALGRDGALARYDRRLRARFRGKDLFSWLLQLILFRPTLARYAITRLSTRSAARERLAAGLADQLPASALFDPRFLARVLAP